MAFPEDVLSGDERVVMHLHPHWKALIRPVFVTLVAIAATILAGIFINQIGLIVVGALALVAIVWLALWPYLVWKTTHYVFTNERVLLQTGVFSRNRRDIPVNRINDHSMGQTFIERLLGCGTLTIESAGERGQSVLSDIPHVERVQTALYEIVEADRDSHSFDDDERPAAPAK
ncbi:MAG: PH domain-containing protein [Hamadaea sp.]|uniref:PH domain-containing protein n=1 Tax=Hamadaea sp. NPDC050747 TaxID=3155789 RepID=UPI0017BEE26B|nr:PH domain-containing protein [Hamadaea sp.]NUR51280.1 PH domain-containing protein [Hamadaea sp.]